MRGGRRKSREEEDNIIRTTGDFGKVFGEVGLNIFYSNERDQVWG